jgi:hypothetical protein
VYPPGDRNRNSNRKHDDYVRASVKNFCLQCLSSKTADRTYLTGRVVDEESKPTPKKSKASSSKYHDAATTAAAATATAAAATATAAAQCDFCCGTASSPPSETQHCIEKYTCNGNHTYNVCVLCHSALQKQFAKWMKQALKFNLKCSTTITKNGTVLLSPQFREENNKKNEKAHISVERWCFVCLTEPQQVGGAQLWSTASLVKTSPTKVLTASSSASKNHIHNRTTGSKKELKKKKQQEQKRAALKILSFAKNNLSIIIPSSTHLGHFLSIYYFLKDKCLNV